MDLKVYLKEQADKAQEASVQYDTDLQAAADKGKAEGIELGRGQIQLPDAASPDAVYTQEQMNSAINDAVSNAESPLKAQLEAVQKTSDKSAADLATAQGDLEAAQKELVQVKGGVDAAKHEAVEAFKKDLSSLYQSQQVAESQEETGFADLLKPAVVSSPVSPVEQPAAEEPPQETPVEGEPAV